MTQSIQEQVRILPTIEPKGHFVQIGGEMLCGDAMPCSDDAALEQGERRFDGVRMNVPVYIDFRFVFDCLVLSLERSIAQGCRVGVEFVGHNEVNVLAHRLSNVLRQSASLNVLRVEEPQIAAALPDADYDLFFGISESWLAVTFLTRTDVGFVYLDSAIHHRAFYFFHRGPDAMAEIPCGFVADSECALDLICGHALTRLTEKQSSDKPFLQGKMRVIKDRAGSDRELIVASLAVKQLLRCSEFRNWPFASQTFNSVRPAKAHKKFAAFIVGIEQVYNVN